MNLCMTDIAQARKLFSGGTYSCVLVRDSIIYTSTLTGVAPLISFIEDGTDLKGFSIADKIIGKAAALLFVYAGIKTAHGITMSRKAAAVFETHSIVYTYDTMTPEIINRTGTGICPMEQAVLAVESPEEALSVLKDTMIHLRTQHKI